jgi:hypothetical protein
MEDALESGRRSALHPRLPTTAKELLEVLINATGLLERMERESAIRFSHTSFYNFFLAHYVVGEKAWLRFLEAREGKRGPFAEGTRDAVPFVCGLLKGFNEKKALLGWLLRNDEIALLGKCILEADKEIYPDPLTEKFLLAQKGRLADLLRDRRARNGEDGPVKWKEDLDTFHAILRESKGNAYPAADRDSRLAEYYAEWIESKGLDRVLVLEAVARHSTLMAINLAEKCGMAWSDLDPVFLVSGCRQESFFRKMIERASQEPDNRKWPMILTEAALRYKSVNDLLINCKDIPHWGSRQPHDGKGGNWIHLKSTPPYFDKRVSQSNLTKGLDLVFEGGNVSDKRMHFLSLLQYLKPSGDYGPRLGVIWIMCVAGALSSISILVLAMLRAQYTYVAMHRLPGWLDYALALPGSILALALLYWYWGRQYRIVTAYNWILMDKSRNQLAVSKAMFRDIRAPLAPGRHTEFEELLEMVTVTEDGRE